MQLSGGDAKILHGPSCKCGIEEVTSTLCIFLKFQARVQCEAITGDAEPFYALDFLAISICIGFCR